MSKIGDFINSKPVQGLAAMINPILTGINPALGSAVSTGLNVLGQLGNVASDYNKSGSVFQTLQNYTNRNTTRVKRGINLARRPDQLSNRIQLKNEPLALMPPEERVIELD
ncbi:MAG: hypothetical protein LBM99_00705 [Bacillales bacterium]|nr:hypothetical protein [Bacillales bacterium]